MNAQGGVILWSLACMLGGTAAVGELPAVNEIARQIPVAYQVDVVVVGGSTGAVAAAVEAAAAGAKVFLAAPWPYLGDDMTATLRLWLEKGEKPVSSLAKRIFDDRTLVSGLPDPNQLGFTYTADQPSAGVHKDTSPCPKLSDHRWGNPVNQSVQYDKDVNLVADLLKTQEVAEVRVIGYQRGSGSAKSDFKVGKLTVFTSDDQKTWKQVATLTSDAARAIDQTVIFSAPVAARTRYVKFFVEKAKGAGRVLLGEIEIVAPARADTKPPAETLPPRPLHVKKTLDDVLLAAGVEFLYSCYATDVLRDGAGNPAGIVMANRAGRQAVLAKTIIDATDRASVTRLCGARFRPYPAGLHTFRRVVIGGQVQTGQDLTARTISPPFRGPFPNPAKASSGTFPIIEYTLRLAMPDDSYASWAAADGRARMMTYHPEQQFTADALFEVPPDPMHAQQPVSGPSKPVDQLPLEALRPAGVARVFVLGGCADVPRDQAEKLLRPTALIELGARVGKAAAAEALSLPAPSGVKLPGQPTPAPVAAGEVREILVGVRPTQQLPTIPQETRSLPVLGSYDVVVVGGGTAGAPAGIAAARQGAKTLVVEQLCGLGGVGTVGAISKYYWGNRVGFSATVAGGASWVIEQKMHWWRSELLKAGAEIWLATIGCGALVENRRVTGVVVATPQGRGVVLAKVVIDATGNADVAAAAGADCIYTDQTEFAMQGTGLPPRDLGGAYANTDFTITDETDMVDTWHVFVYAKEKYPHAFDQGTLIDTRERRRIVGDFTITLLDEINGRTYPDTVVVAYSNYDTHGYTVDPYLMLKHPEKQGFRVNVPYRSLLPRGLDGIFVGGLAVSAHRDALPLIRMQADMQNQGYALGVAAAMTAKAGTLTRHIDIRALQQHLVQIDNLPESVLTDQDSYPLPREVVAAAVESIKQDLQGAAVVLTQPDQALPLLRKAYAAAEGEAKLAYARVLGVMGDATGLETLIWEVRRAPAWDAGWRFRGGGQFGQALSSLDTVIIALGRTRDRRAVPVILEKLKLLSAESEFSHHRAVGLALELIGDPAAAKPLADLLTLPDMSGYVHSSIDTARQREVPHGSSAVQSRDESLRELLLARALYRCGDYNGMGEKILGQYTKDLRGHLSRHAQAVLQSGRTR